MIFMSLYFIISYFPKIKVLRYKSEFLKECSQNMQTADLLCICFSINILFQNQIINCHCLHHHWEDGNISGRKNLSLGQFSQGFHYLPFHFQLPCHSFIRAFIHSSIQDRPPEIQVTGASLSFFLFNKAEDSLCKS